MRQAARLLVFVMLFNRLHQYLNLREKDSVARAEPYLWLQYYHTIYSLISNQQLVCSFWMLLK